MSSPVARPRKPSYGLILLAVADAMLVLGLISGRVSDLLLGTLLFAVHTSYQEATIRRGEEREDLRGYDKWGGIAFVMLIAVAFLKYDFFV